MLKEGVRKVDRHGFREDDPEEGMQEAMAKHAIRDEYYAKML